MQCNAEVEVQAAVDQEQEYERGLVNGPQSDGASTPGMPGVYELSCCVILPL
jgi:hypothetical protein